MFDRETILENAALNPAPAPAATAGERSAIEWRLFRDQQVTNADLAAVDHEYERYVGELEQQTGQRLKTPTEQFGLRGNRPFVSIENAREQFLGDVRALSEKFPGIRIRSHEEILADIGVARAEQRAEAEAVRARTIDTSVSLAGFGAQAGAAITDPVVVGSMAIGAPVSAGVLRTALIEAGIAAAAEVPIQTQVQLGRRKFGEDPSASEALQSIAAAGAGGFLFGGLLKTAVKSPSIYRGLIEKSRQLPESQRSPAIRAAESHLERVAEVEEARPFVGSAQGRASHADRTVAAETALRDGRVVDLPPATQKLEPGVLVGRDIPSGPDVTPLEKVLSDVRAAVVERQPTNENARAVAEALEPILDDEDALAVLLRDLNAESEKAQTFRQLAKGETAEKAQTSAISETSTTKAGVSEAASIEAAGARSTPTAENVGRDDPRSDVSPEEGALSTLRDSLAAAGIDVRGMTPGTFRNAAKRLADDVRTLDRGPEPARMGRAGADAVEVDERVAQMAELDAEEESLFIAQFEGRETETLVIADEAGNSRHLTVAELQRELQRTADDAEALKLCTIGG